MSRWKTAWFIFILCAATGASQAQTFTDLATFDFFSDFKNGIFPYGPLVQGLDGNLYGTTYGGGREICYGGCGTIFKITPAGTLATVHEFVGTDGQWPKSGLIVGADGSFYGTTSCSVFRMTPEGTLTTLSSAADCGSAPQIIAPLMQDTIDGNFYGTTLGGLARHQCDGPCGTVFKITPGGTLTTLYNFCNLKYCVDGLFPAAPLVQGRDGFLYGTASEGGNPAFADNPGSNGTIFKIGTEGALNVLHEFGATDDSSYPLAGLIVGADGDFYGTTAEETNCSGGISCGTIFKITPEGILTELHVFSYSNLTNGTYPTGGLIQANDGNFYGTTTYGGAFSCKAGAVGCGTVFQMTPDGTLTTLHSFDETDGMWPYTGLVQGTDGNFYGTTVGFDGNHVYGSVFKLSMGLAPFVKTVPTAAHPGKMVIILGTDLTGATSVTFGGMAAAFTLVSATEITATVPDGPCAGAVQVVTPSGTLSSDVPFRVF